MVVGVVALPLSMALAIAVGVPPQHGLYTAIVAGAIVALTGGSKFQVTGPTAAFVVILSPIASRHGLSGLLTAGLMAGVLLVAMGVARLGKLIQFIPHPGHDRVHRGDRDRHRHAATEGLLRASYRRDAGDLPRKGESPLAARHDASLPDVAVALVTLVGVLMVPRFFPRCDALRAGAADDARRRFTRRGSGALVRSFARRRHHREPLPLRDRRRADERDPEPASCPAASLGLGVISRSRRSVSWAPRLSPSRCSAPSNHCSPR